MRYFRVLFIVFVFISLVTCTEEITPEAPKASFNLDVENDFVFFTNNSTPEFANYYWDFGDGNFTRKKNPLHQYDESGEYTVTLTVRNEAGESTISKNLTVVNERKLIKINTAYGDIIIWLWDDTPLHKENFFALADTGFFDGTTFHRIFSESLIQGGDPNSKDADPTNDGFGGPGYTIPAEIIPNRTHIHGAVGAARADDNVNPNKDSNGSQFYIVADNNGLHIYDGNYTVFGQVIHGLSVVSSISNKSVVPGTTRPIIDIRMQVRVIEYTLEELQNLYGFTPW